ncbi:hypothetical protein AB0B01_28150 [Streptomyces sp. NPDC044571]|uniref:nSTAND1 domain-containing NTPase n=1 Tax=Streptomyces sp. NPDC044571 TaxID=3155371 RepID=UPI0033E17DA9
MTTPGTADNPYVGLRPFTEHDRHLFFGRKREAEVLYNMVYSTPLTLVYAPSGVGKSSLLQAGLGPALDTAGGFTLVYVDTWRPPVAEQLSSLIAEDFRSAERTGAWCDQLRCYGAETGSCPVLILDQFEEALRYRDGLDTVWEELAVLGTHPRGGARVVVGIREDYLAGLDELLSRVPTLIENGLRLGPMSRTSMQHAFRGPLDTLAPPFEAEDGLFEELVADLGTEGPSGTKGYAEPGYFQVVCRHLWELDSDRPDRTLTRATYEQEGRAAGVLRSYVRGKLDDSMPSDHLEILYAIIRYLVTPTGAKVLLGLDDLSGLVTTRDFTPQARRMFGLDDDEQPFESLRLRHLLHETLEALCVGGVLILRRVVCGTTTKYELFHDLLGPILLDWRDRKRSRGERDLAQLAEPVQGLRWTARASLDRASAGLVSLDGETRREVVRELGEVLMQSKVLREDTLSHSARSRLEELRQAEDWKLRLEAGRALGQPYSVETPSWRRALLAVVGYVLLSAATVVALVFGAHAFLLAVTDIEVPGRGFLVLALGWVALVWALVYFAEGVSDQLYSSWRPWHTLLNAPFEPYLQGYGWFERSSGWPLNFILAVVPAVVLAPVLAQVALPFMFWLIVLVCLCTGIGLVAYNRAVVLI